MRFTLPQTVLLRVLKRLATTLPKKTTLPILTTVFLCVKGSVVELCTHKLSAASGIALHVQQGRLESGSVCTPFQDFQHAVKHAGPDVTVQKTLEGLQVYGSGETPILPSNPVEEFPLIPQVPASLDEHITLSPRDLQTALKAVRRLDKRAARDAQIRMELRNQVLTVQSADQGQVYQSSIPAVEGGNTSWGLDVCVNYETFQNVVKNLSDGQVVLTPKIYPFDRGYSELHITQTTYHCVLRATSSIDRQEQDA